MSKHTPGPWKIRNDITKDTLICSENKTIICGIHQKNLNILSETKANAQLIAAAPELLKAAEEVISYYKNEKWLNYLGVPEFNKLKRVINKANGDK